MGFSKKMENLFYAIAFSFGIRMGVDGVDLFIDGGEFSYTALIIVMIAFFGVFCFLDFLLEFAVWVFRAVKAILENRKEKKSNS